MATAKKAPAPKAPAKKASTHTARGLKQDRALVAVKQAYEVSYVSKETKKSAAEVRQAIEEKGHSRVKVVEALGGVKKPAKKKAS